MRDAGRLTPEEHLRASAELERIFAGPKPADDRQEPPEDEVATSTSTSTSSPIDPDRASDPDLDY